jgi:hypothetical protein
MKTNLFFLIPLIILGQKAISQNSTPPQFSIGVHGSPTLHVIDWDGKRSGEGMDDQIYTSTVKSLTGYMAGISFQYNFLPNLALHTEINYEKTGNSFQQDEDYERWGCFGPLAYKSTRWESGFKFPTTLKYTIKTGNKTNLFLHAGTSICAFNKQSTKFEYFSGVDYPAYQSKEPAYNQALIGIGAEFKLTQHFNITMEARDYFYERSIHATNWVSIKSAEHSFRLMIGLTYRIK